MKQYSIGDRLRELRTAKNVNQDQAAEGCGISRIALARYETGARTPRAEIVALLADYYGVTVDYILGREEAKEQQEVQVMFRSDLFDVVHKLTPENRRIIESLARELFEAQKK